MTDVCVITSHTRVLVNSIGGQRPERIRSFSSLSALLPHKRMNEAHADKTDPPAFGFSLESNLKLENEIPSETYAAWRLYQVGKRKNIIQFLLRFVHPLVRYEKKIP